MQYKFGLALSGGGTRGAAHIGVIKALEESGIEPDIISGCSAGALVGALYAANHSADDIYYFFKHTSLFSHPSLTINHPGFFESNKYIEDLAPLFPDDRFEALNKKLKVYSTDLVKGTLVEHESGPVTNCVIASCAIPGIFTPVEMNGQMLSDGGIINVFPVSKIRKETENILGVLITAPGVKTREQIKNTRHVLDRAFLLNIHSKAETEARLCDWLINPEEIGGYKIISKKNLQEMYQIGYDHAINLIDSLKLSLTN